MSAKPGEAAAERIIDLAAKLDRRGKADIESEPMMHRPAVRGIGRQKPPRWEVRIPPMRRGGGRGEGGAVSGRPATPA